MKRNLFSMTFRLMAFAFLGLLLLCIAGCGESGSPSSDTNDPIDDGSAATTNSVSLSASSNSVPTDDATSTDITAYVIDSNRAAIQGKRVSFSTTGGQISASSAITDANGQAVIKFMSGTDKLNQTVVITGVADGRQAEIPISIYGTELTLSPATAQISTATSKVVTIKAVDANAKPIAGTDALVSLVSGPSDLSFSTPLPSTFTTNSTGEATFTVTAGNIAGEAVIRAEALGTTATAKYQIGASESIFKIIDPTDDSLSSPADGSSLKVRVQAGGMKAGETVVLITSFGQWSNGLAFTEFVLTADDGEVTGQLTPTGAGVASIQAYAKANMELTDTIRILFYNPESEAAAITVEASEQNLPPSTGGAEYSITIMAKVTAVGGAPVGDAVVDFSLSNTTGGGEYLSPVAVKTDEFGEAATTFTSGTLGTGSEIGDAVLITARVDTPKGVNPTDTDTIPIIIHGEAANISIGFSSQISTNEDGTMNLWPISVLVADTNGNPVSGKTVSLGLRPSFFHTGHWVKWDDEWKPMFYNSCEGAPDPPVYFTYPQQAAFINEDLNGNAALDGTEDEVDGYYFTNPDLPAYFGGYTSGQAVPGLGDLVLTPGQSCAGTIPSSVTTDEKGVASFTLTYQKEYAYWVEVQITASSTVFGTENITKVRKMLPIISGEEEAIANAFPQSPFNVFFGCGVVP